MVDLAQQDTCMAKYKAIKGSNSKLQEEQRRNRPSKTEASKLNRAKTALTNANQRKPV